MRVGRRRGEVDDAPRLRLLLLPMRPAGPPGGIQPDRLRKERPDEQAAIDSRCFRCRRRFHAGDRGRSAEGRPAAKPAPAKLEKPADVSAEAWAKMTDAEKQKAVDKAKTAAAEPKKPKKGGC